MLLPAHLTAAAAAAAVAVAAVSPPFSPQVRATLEIKREFLRIVSSLTSRRFSPWTWVS